MARIFLDRSTFLPSARYLACPLDFTRLIWPGSGNDKTVNVRRIDTGIRTPFETLQIRSILTVLPGARHLSHDSVTFTLTVTNGSIFQILMRFSFAGQWPYVLAQSTADVMEDENPGLEHAVESFKRGQPRALSRFNSNGLHILTREASDCRGRICKRT